MRNYYSEADMLCAEVQQVLHDGTLALQTRSVHYGKLTRHGMCIVVPPALIRRSRQHFYSFGPSVGVHMILGMNGMIWLQPLTAATVLRDDGNEDAEMQDADEDIAAVKKRREMEAAADAAIPLEIRTNMCRIANCIRALAGQLLPISVQAIETVLEDSVHLSPGSMLSPEVQRQITRRV